MVRLVNIRLWAIGIVLAGVMAALLVPVPAHAFMCGTSPCNQYSSCMYASQCYSVGSPLTLGNPPYTCTMYCNGPDSTNRCAYWGKCV
jgi:hypothetical protein